MSFAKKRVLDVAAMVKQETEFCKKTPLPKTSSKINQS
jgi:hypothetical protein